MKSIKWKVSIRSLQSFKQTRWNKYANIWTHIHIIPRGGLLLKNSHNLKIKYCCKWRYESKCIANKFLKRGPLSVIFSIETLVHILNGTQRDWELLEMIFSVSFPLASFTELSSTYIFGCSIVGPSKYVYINKKLTENSHTQSIRNAVVL